MYSRNFFNTFLLVMASLFQLSFLGLLPQYGYKIFGDILLFIIFIRIFLGKKKNNHIKSSDKFIIINHIIAVTFIVFTLFLILYTSLMYDTNLFTTIKYSRRWLIFGLYLLMLTYVSYNIYFFDFNMLKNIYFVLSVISIIIILLNQKYSLDFKGITQGINYQGGQIVYKTFSPGNFLVITIFIYFTFIYLNIPKIKNFILLILFFLITFNIIRFRSWIIATFFSILFTWLIIIVKKNSIFHTLRYIIMLIIISLFIIIFWSKLKPSFINKINWLSSAYYDFIYNEGSWKYRYEVDIYKLYQFTENNINIIVGNGFLGEKFKLVKFQTITNDTGFVEVILTGGLISSLLVLSIFILKFVHLYKYITKDIFIQVAFVTWIVVFVLMISSNLLLWDFGFVPLFIISILAEIRRGELIHK